MSLRATAGSQRDEKFTPIYTFKTSCDFVTPVAEAATGATLRPGSTHLLRSVAQIASSWVRSTRNFKPIALGGGVRSEADGPVNGVCGHRNHSGPFAKPSDPATPPRNVVFLKPSAGTR